MDESAAALSAGGIGDFAMTFVFCMKEILPLPRRKVKFSFVAPQFSPSPPQEQGEEGEGKRRLLGIIGELHHLSSVLSTIRRIDSIENPPLSEFPPRVYPESCGA